MDYLFLYENLPTEVLLIQIGLVLNLKSFLTYDLLFFVVLHDEGGWCISLFPGT
jgi:hypothetical protein